MKLSVRILVRCGSFAAVIAVTSGIAIPLPIGVPITLQTFAVALCGYTLGAKAAVLSTAVYLAVGALGAPVFSGFRGGLQMLTGATGGYLFGFLAMAALCGLFTRGRLMPTVGGLAGMLACHAFGAAWFGFVTGRTFIEAVMAASVPYLIKDTVSVLFAEILGIRLRRHLK